MMNDTLGNTKYLLKCLMDNITDMIYCKDLDSRFLMLNEACAIWQGNCSPAELIGKSDFDTYAAEDARHMRDDEERIMATGEPLVGIEEHLSWPDGTEAWVSSTKMPLRNEAGDIIGIIGISRDITEHKKTELREARYAAEVHRYAEEMKRINNEIEDDLRLAGKLQKAFFPTSYPVFPAGSAPEGGLVEFHHYQHSGGVIGGDFCSIHKLSETEAGIFLCDVMGHGVRAALGTAVIRALADDIFSAERDPGRCLARMNNSLIPFLHSEEEVIFATACYLVLNLATGSIAMANAGHPVPVCLGADGQVELSAEKHSRRGPALALMKHASYPTTQRKINPGDAVVMFTDGIFEIARGDKEEYGEQRLLEAFRRHRHLPLPELFPAVLKEARLFAGEESFDDDVCIVGFRLRGPL
jgi:sigma-B regulation protein RsbU (phosphoserine phosphatase)